MKTAISLPDELFETADKLARRLGITRSKLYSTALTEFVARNKTSKVTERLNAYYSVEDSRLDKGLREVARRTLRRSEW